MSSLRENKDATGLLNQIAAGTQVSKVSHSIMFLLVSPLPGSAIGLRKSRHGLGVVHVAPHKEKAF